MSDQTRQGGLAAGGYRVLIADDEESLRFVLRELLSREGLEIDDAANGREAVELAQHNGYDLYLLDIKMPEMDGMEALREIRRLYPRALVVMITAFGSTQMAVDALKLGAYDYFTKPFNIEELRIVLLRALEKQRLLRQVQKLQEQLGAPESKDGLIGQCPAMRQVFTMVDRVAEHDVTVLISGESGTGKELVARAVHNRSPRVGGPFVTVNCAAIPEPLLESELFGHEKGAFTGAVCARPGRFEAADKGTLVLDEIGEMPLALQAKLLRALQEREIERVGSNVPRPVDIRVVAATNRDLGQMVAEKRFREDLYFRLNVVQLHLPPLRERTEDISTLVQHFIGKFNVRFGKGVEGVSPEALALLERYDWPGNIRELENVIQRAMVMAGGTRIGPEALPVHLRERAAGGESSWKAESPAAGHHGGPAGDASTLIAMPPIDFSAPLAKSIEKLIEEAEKRHIATALERAGGRRQQSADLLGISRKSLHNKMQKYGMFERGED